MDVTLRNSIPEDIEWLVELRAQVLRADLERLGRFDAVRVRRRMRDAFAPEHTRVVVVDGCDRGSITVRPDADTRWIEHFYLAPDAQGRGIGSTVLRTVLSASHTGTTRLNVLQGSPARRLYERHGFVVDTEDDVDVFMTLRDPDRGPHGAS
ncbi:acetyltransferase (GNAT) family protein [Curtobacterium sp. PhB172]|uniref:GNAT family N-acetyltransferase n=1 Tax=unclassified Curtobacterium TaxID=257496 RepID=UPI000FBA8CD3|nr:MULTISPECIES: GNAT family N-acetyltransferase [unclassified Curtobacterium]ROQ07171.1 acetyltransferase (GNAT) family protein [Curtobacterium sp. PhB171]ROQ28097.1 acetyltransferase (GNAT) family protein [Curtobacterium sp. PhB170]ROS35027.1 acetyltransferase (GNAT) family protein [Curtobacterium sp. PhB131]ROS64142.1 acetyltransferase (GNAT) family protein [Curtobacterium sp. PhB172]ROS72606.1 acetyltransferase (GNAT) family protein [Curtobacterium sp. PhB141]